MAESIDDLKEHEKFMADGGGKAGVARGRCNWTGGLILIGIGVIFLIANLTSFHLHNWWALFILMPAAGALGGSWGQFRQHGRLTPASIRPLVGGLILTLVAAIFLFDLDWGMMWPFFLIFGGVGALLAGLVD